MNEGPGFVANLSQSLGTTQDALRLLLSVLAGYPLALVHRKLLYGRNANIQHVYFLLTGFAIGYYNYGIDVLHSFAAMLFTYTTLAILGGSSIAVAIIFIFNMGYLLTGYYWVGTEHYDINWTMPQCVLVLRLIGLAFDVYDGSQPLDSLSEENKKDPTIPPSSTEAAIKRFLLGVAYLIIFQLVLTSFVSNEYMLSDEYNNLNFVKKCFMLGVWGRFTLYKYIFCWLLTEGACILFGLTYNGEDEHGIKQWNGVENVKILLLENATEFNHYIQSFNINTNHWVGQYVYKRLKFLGNRLISQAAALLFLAVWHGFHSGYYASFAFEFLVMYLEKDLKPLIKGNEKLSGFLSKPPVSILVYLLLRVYTFVFMGWCLLPFALLTFDRYWQVYGSVYYMGFFIFGLYPVLYGPILRLLLKSKRSRAD